RSHRGGRRGHPRDPRAPRGGPGPADAPGDGDAPAGAAPLGVPRMNAAWAETRRTWLRVGAGVYPVYGDELRGWSPEPQDFRGLAASPFVYGSLEELFFALVNLTVSGGEVRRRAMGNRAH